MKVLKGFMRESYLRRVAEEKTKEERLANKK